MAFLEEYIQGAKYKRAANDSSYSMSQSYSARDEAGSTYDAGSNPPDQYGFGKTLFNSGSYSSSTSSSGHTFGGNKTIRAYESSQEGAYSSHAYITESGTGRSVTRTYWTTNFWGPVRVSEYETFTWNNNTDYGSSDSYSASDGLNTVFQSSANTITTTSPSVTTKSQVATSSANKVSGYATTEFTKESHVVCSTTTMSSVSEGVNSSSTVTYTAFTSEAVPMTLTVPTTNTDTTSSQASFTEIVSTTTNSSSGTTAVDPYDEWVLDTKYTPINGATLRIFNSTKNAGFINLSNAISTQQGVYIRVGRTPNSQSQTVLPKVNRQEWLDAETDSNATISLSPVTVAGGPPQTLWRATNSGTAVETYTMGGYDPYVVGGGTVLAPQPTKNVTLNVPSPPVSYTASNKLGIRQFVTFNNLVTPVDAGVILEKATLTKVTTNQDIVYPVGAAFLLTGQDSYSTQTNTQVDGEGVTYSRSGQNAGATADDQGRTIRGDLQNRGVFTVDFTQEAGPAVVMSQPTNGTMGWGQPTKTFNPKVYGALDFELEDSSSPHVGWSGRFTPLLAMAGKDGLFARMGDELRGDEIAPKFFPNSGKCAVAGPTSEYTFSYVSKDSAEPGDFDTSTVVDYSFNWYSKVSTVYQGSTVGTTVTFPTTVDGGGTTSTDVETITGRASLSLTHEITNKGGGNATYYIRYNPLMGYNDDGVDYSRDMELRNYWFNINYLTDGTATLQLPSGDWTVREYTNATGSPIKSTLNLPQGGTYTVQKGRDFLLEQSPYIKVFKSLGLNYEEVGEVTTPALSAYYMQYDFPYSIRYDPFYYFP